MQSFDGKVVVVTGGSRGIGAATVREFARRGATVAFTFKARKEKAEELAKSVGGQSRVVAYCVDVADEGSVHKAFDDIGQTLGKIDVLVNNAGVLGARPIEEVDFPFYAEQFNVNVWGTIAATQAALKHFSPKGGAIVNISSLRTSAPINRTGIYSAAKAAVATLTQALAIELGPRNIRVNAVSPGITRTDMTAAMPDSRRQAILEATPLRRLGEPEDVASAVIMLASDDAKWITGRTILADGGFTGAA